MASSRSAKDICQQYGPGSIDCNVAKAVERNRAPRDESPTPPPQQVDSDQPGSKRTKQIEDALRKAGA